jgi:hypothetical protein
MPGHCLGLRVCGGSVVALSRCRPHRRWFPGRWDRPSPMSPATALPISHGRKGIATSGVIRTACRRTISSHRASDRRLVHFCIIAMRRPVSILISRLAGRRGVSCRPADTDRDKLDAIVETPSRHPGAAAVAQCVRDRTDGANDPGDAGAGQAVRGLPKRSGGVQAVRLQPGTGRRAAGEQPTGRHRRHRHPAGRRSGIGGTAVGAGPSAQANYSLQQRYDLAYAQCMYARGNQVPGYQAPVAAPPPGYAPPGYPPAGYGYPPPGYAPGYPPAPGG